MNDEPKNMDYKEVIKQWKLGSSYTARRKSAVREYAEAGINCIEFGLPRDIPPKNYFNDIIRDKEPQRIVETIVSENIELVSLHLPFGPVLDISSRKSETRKAVLELYSQIINWISGYGIKRLVVHPSPGDVEPAERDERTHNCRESLSILSRYANEYNIKVAVENLLSYISLGNSGAAVEELISPFPEIGVCCDMNHSLLETTEDFINRIGSRICTVHVSDYNGKAEGHMLPGKGVNNWQNILKLLVKYNYPGPFMYEVMGSAASPKMLYDNWQALLKG
ncbi:MAG: sugar phosphate isomerase/epimerase family protein [Elusimicrobiota bacterium]